MSVILDPKLLAYVSYTCSINALRFAQEEIESTIQALRFARESVGIDEETKKEIGSLFSNASREHGDLLNKAIEAAINELKKIKEN